MACASNMVGTFVVWGVMRLAAVLAAFEAEKTGAAVSMRMSAGFHPREQMMGFGHED
jgi:hypothetical protein